MTISADEFLRRFLLHTLPRGFVRIRFFGFLGGPRRSKMLQLARQLLQVKHEPDAPVSTPATFRAANVLTTLVSARRRAAQYGPFRNRPAPT